MEDPNGGLSFDFEEGLESRNATGKLLKLPLTSKDLNLPHPSYLASGGNKASVRTGSKSSRGTVCRHWLKGLCMKGDACEYLHQYDKDRMPICRNFARYGECWEEDCEYKHTRVEMKECVIDNIEKLK